MTPSQIAEQPPLLDVPLPEGAPRPEPGEPCCWAFPWREESDKWRYRWFDVNQERLQLWFLVAYLLTGRLAPPPREYPGCLT